MKHASSRTKNHFTRSTRRQRRLRAGALFSFETLILTPIIAGLFFAMVEFSMICYANQQLKLASQVACRVGTLPATDVATQTLLVEAKVLEALGQQSWRSDCQISFVPAAYSGDPVVVEVRVPMNSAAPDLLGVLGFSLSDRWLVARTTMPKE